MKMDTMLFEKVEEVYKGRIQATTHMAILIFYKDMPLIPNAHMQTNAHT